MVHARRCPVEYKYARTEDCARARCRAQPRPMRSGAHGVRPFRPPVRGASPPRAASNPSCCAHSTDTARAQTWPAALNAAQLRRLERPSSRARASQLTPSAQQAVRGARTQTPRHPHRRRYVRAAPCAVHIEAGASVLPMVWERHATPVTPRRLHAPLPSACISLPSPARRARHGPCASAARPPASVNPVAALGQQQALGWLPAPPHVHACESAAPAGLRPHDRGM